MIAAAKPLPAESDLEFRAKTCVRVLMRPRWIVGESWPGYLLRLAAANEVSGIQGLGKLLEVTAVRLVFSNPVAVLERFGVHHQDLPRLVLPHTAEAVKPSDARVTRHWASGVCPRCLVDDKIPFIHAEWEFPLQVDCSRHGAELIRACPSCHRNLSIYRSRLMHCDCGLFLPNATSRPLLRTVPDTLLHDIFDVRKGDQTFSKITAAEVMARSALLGIAHFERHGDNARTAPRVTHQRYLTVDDLHLAEGWFREWPQSFKNRYISAGWDRESNESRYVTQALLRSSHFSKLDRIIGPLTGQALDVRRGCKYVNLDGAAALVNETPTKVRAWLDAGCLGECKRSPNGLQFRIRVAALLKYAESIRDTVTTLEASQWLGVMPRAIARLLEHGILQRANVHSSEVRIRQRDLRSFLKAMTASACEEVHVGEGVRSLGAMFESTHRLTSRKTFEAVRLGQLDVYRVKGEAPSLATSYVYKRQFARMVHGLKRKVLQPSALLRVIVDDIHFARRGDEWVTLQAAEKIGAVSRPALTSWIAESRLGPVEIVGRRECVQLASLLQLLSSQESLMTFRQAGLMLDVPRKVIIALIRDGLVRGEQSGIEAKVSTSDLVSVQQRLVTAVCPRPRPTTPRTIRPIKAVFGSPFPGAVADALAAIESGHLKVFADPADSPGLANMWVMERAYEAEIASRYRHSTRIVLRDEKIRHGGRLLSHHLHLAIRGDETVTWKDAMAITGRPSIVLKQWVDAKLIQTERRGQLLTIRVTQVLRAMDAMVNGISATEAAKMLGTRRMALYRLIEAGELTPVHMRNKTAIIDRTQVESFLRALFALSKARAEQPVRMRRLTDVLESPRLTAVVNSLAAIRDGRISLHHSEGSSPSIANCYVDAGEWWVQMVGRNHAAAFPPKAARAAR